MNKNIVDSMFIKNQGYEVAAFCTFRLNLNFFENYLLKLDGLSNCDSISIFTDSSTYESFTQDATNYHPRWLNRKYMVSSVKTEGIFHPKIYLMASEKKAQIAIGSSNLTREGIASNLETISLFEVTEKDRKYAGLLNDCILFFKDLAKISKGSLAQDKISEIEEVVCKLVDDGDDEIKFIHNLDKSLLSQVKYMLKDEYIENIKVISPFYDNKLNVISELNKDYPEASLEIYLQQHKSNFPVKEFVKNKHEAELYLFEGIERYMHGKALIFQSKSNNYLLTGSANFTDSALMKYGRNGNVEVGLFGIIEGEIVEQLITPTDIKANKVKRPERIKSTLEKEELFNMDSKPSIDYINEVVEETGVIYLSVEDDIGFKPTTLILYKNNEKIEIKFNKEVDLKELGLNNYKDIYAVQVRGIYDNISLDSNTVWILRLEKKSEDYIKKKYRKIINNPDELIFILNEILASGDEEELVRFLMEFDIPLDLILTPSHLKKFFYRESKGNVTGELLRGSYSLLDTSEISKVFDNFLGKLLKKLYMHYDNIQIEKLPNFMLIFSTIFSMIEFIDSRIYEENNGQVVTAEKWSEIREYYNMLLRYIKDLWVLLNIDTKEYISFRNKFNYIISEGNDILDDVKTFEEYIVQDYKSIYNKSLNISASVMKSFKNMLNSIKVKTVVDTIVKPRISTNDLYINEINDIFKIVKNSKL
ncbi:hypothetical protein HCG68_01880 [Paeniclostridium sordellii]|nr:hypothetical protein [Paeniclostridium sordellii]